MKAELAMATEIAALAWELMDEAINKMKDDPAGLPEVTAAIMLTMHIAYTRAAKLYAKEQENG